MLSCNTLVQAVESYASVQVLVFLDVFEARLVQEIAHERKCFSLHALSPEPTEFSGWHEHPASLNYQCGEPVRLHPHRARADTVGSRLPPTIQNPRREVINAAGNSQVNLTFSCGRSDSLCAQHRGELIPFPTCHSPGHYALPEVLEPSSKRSEEHTSELQS